MIYWEILLESENVKQTLERLYIDFQGIKPLAEHLGISALTLRKKFEELDIKMRPRGGPHYKVSRVYFPDKWWNMGTDQLVQLTGYSINYIRRIRREKLCQLAQSIKTNNPDSLSSTPSPSSLPDDPEKES